MEENELRIGNLVYDYDGKVSTVTSIDHRSIRVNNESIGFSGLSLNPIPLNYEWLLKLGFEKDGNEFSKDRFIIRLDQRSLIIQGFEYDYNGILLGTENLYVHDLQNLYFAVKREELTIKTQTDEIKE
ncbi:hypothetical protein SAMN05421866_0052 [Chryseobacterium oranimense]|uniref:Uncharacterized protein n=1 Tax=Chryseobacterium oranimense TaxID=421058 RepID=A0A1M5X8V2_9FLAO|nr:hypothetical protein [Chryseobacterium oranimense]SHH96072.1 hypothetical protein SAMN05421866_0052 [Chryseobacterium oranimense]